MFQNFLSRWYPEPVHCCSFHEIRPCSLFFGGANTQLSSPPQNIQNEVRKGSSSWEQNTFPILEAVNHKLLPGRLGALLWLGIGLGSQLRQV